MGWVDPWVGLSWVEIFFSFWWVGSSKAKVLKIIYIILYLHYIYSDVLQNAPFRSQIFKIFVASGGMGALTPLTKILRTFLITS